MTWAVIFDMDGVLIDSADAHFQSWRQLAGEQGCSFDRAAFDRTFGRTSRSILLEEFDPDLSDAEVQALDHRKEALYRAIIRDAFPAMPGAAALIDDLRAAGARLAVGSSGPPENVKLVLEGLDRASAFEVIVTGVDVTRGKPDPQVFEIAASRLKMEPRRCVVIEDAPAGIDAAHAAGMPCVGLVSSGRSAGELAAADVIIESLHEIDAAGIEAMLER